MSDKKLAIPLQNHFKTFVFVGVALANRAKTDVAQRTGYLHTIDSISNDTLAKEQLHGQFYFLMAYARIKDFVNPSRSSVFVDGEIAMMPAARRLVTDDARYASDAS